METLYAVSKNKKIKFWEVKVETCHSFSSIITTFGYVDGEKQTTYKQITKGKNIGKVNETTHYQQALLEAQSAWNKKTDKGYVTDPSGVSNIKLPMLAQDFSKQGHNITFPCYAQPKLDGMRAIAHRVNDSTIHFYTRQGKKLNTLSHISQELIQHNLLQVGEYLDGELYNHELSLQEIISLVRSEKQVKDRSAIQYWVYDLADPSITFGTRIYTLSTIFTNTKPTYTKLLDTQLCEKHDVDSLHEEYVARGFEGLILRNKDGKYLFNHRSADLQKVKAFQTEEFIIVDVLEGTGKDVGAAIFVCSLPNGETFNVRPKATYQQRQEWYNQAAALKNKQLTVQFFNYTPDGIPFLPVGLAIRDYE